MAGQDWNANANVDGGRLVQVGARGGSFKEINVDTAAKQTELAPAPPIVAGLGVGVRGINDAVSRNTSRTSGTSRAPNSVSTASSPPPVDIALPDRAHGHGWKEEEALGSSGHARMASRSSPPSHTFAVDNDGRSWYAGVDGAPYPDTPKAYDSRSALLYSGRPFGTPPDLSSKGAQMPPRPPPPPGRDGGRGRLGGLRWHSWWNMFAFGVFGLACAVGHHAFYQHLDGRAATEQIEMLRYGTVLAFGAKAGFSASIVVAYRLKLWAVLRTRLMTVAAVDSMFAATDDLLALFHWDFIRHAKTVAALALFVWAAPLVVILTGNTLLVELRTVVDASTCNDVRTLNFSFEDVMDWRKPVVIDSLYETPLSLWNTTRPAGANPPPDGWFDYYTGPNPKFVQTATLGAFFEAPIERKNSSVEICQSGWNCTYDVAFQAPGYKCTELASGVGSVPRPLRPESGLEARAPFGTDMLLPRGRFAYYAFNTGGEYSSTQMRDVGIGGIPNSKPPYPRNMGAFRTEPLIWIGHVVRANPDRPDPKSRSDPAWNSSFVPKIFACEHYLADYKVHFNHSDGAQWATVASRRWLRPLVNTTFIPDVQANDGTADNTTARPSSNYVLPTGDVGAYRRAAAHYSMGFMVRKLLNGTVEMGGPEDAPLVNPIANTDALQTKLLDRRANYFPFPNLQDLVQGFYEDAILSMFSYPQFAPVVWAARPAEQTGDRRASAAASAAGVPASAYGHPCVRSRTANVYVYHARDLWIVYGVAILLVLLGVAAGLWALLWEQGQGGRVARNTRFSSIVASTRGPALDAVPWAAGREGRLPPSVLAARIGYGLLPPSQRAGRGFVSGRHGGGGGGDGDGAGAAVPLRQASSASAGSIGSSLDPSAYGFGLEGEVRQPVRQRSVFKL
ncbi:hypothetical protein RB601_008295 [Gaeumannomyces tritici]